MYVLIQLKLFILKLLRNLANSFENENQIPATSNVKVTEILIFWGLKGYSHETKESLTRISSANGNKIKCLKIINNTFAVLQCWKRPTG